jgi:tetratricopeptide (TPR) repeat protein
MAGPALAQAQGSARTAELEMRLAMTPDDPSLYVALASEQERLGDRARAESTLRRGLIATADARAVRAALADLLARTSRWTDAIAVMESLGTDSRTKGVLARMRVNAGIVAYRRGDRAAARALWQRALTDDPGLSEAAVNLGALLLELGEPDAARAVVTRALTLHPEHDQLRTLRAATAGGAAATAAAITELKRRRAGAPADERLGLELASLLASTGARKEAAAVYDTLLKAPRPSSEAYQAAARFWISGHQPALATQVAERGLERYPRSGDLLALLGEAEAEAGEWRKAATAYRRATRLLPNPEDAEIPLLDALVSGGDTADAIGVVRDMAARPATRPALLRGAALATALHVPGLADSMYRDMLARDSLDLDALEAEGDLAEAAGDTARAVMLYTRAAGTDSSGPIAPLALLRLTRPDAVARRQLWRRAAWRGLAELERLELATAAVARGDIDLKALAAAKPQIDRRKRIVGLVRMVLDSVVLGTPWGAAELAQLRLSFPGSALLDRYYGTLAERSGDDSSALRVYDDVLRREPTDVATQEARAALLARIGRGRESIDAYTRALDLTPEGENAFRALQQARQADGSLDQLLAQVRRLRVRLPRSRVLREHEVEVLQRLGRLAEAADSATKLREIKP